MTYLGGDQILLFGGIDPGFSTVFNDTWVYDLSDNNWTLKNPSTSPAARFNHAMASVGADQVALFSGDGAGNDTWLYDLSDNNWSLKNPPASPAAVSGHAMSNIGDDKIVLFGVIQVRMIHGYMI